MSTVKNRSSVAQILARRKTTVHKPSVLLDIGQVWCKVGYVGEALTRHVIRSPYVTMTSKLRFGQMTSTEKRVFKRVLKGFLRTVCYELLLVVPSECTVVLCENNLSRYIDKEVLLDLLLIDFGFKTATSLPVLGCCMLSHGQTSALVIDCGYSSIRVLPFISNCPYTGAWQEVHVGTKTIAKEMLASLQEVKKSESPSQIDGIDILASDETALLNFVEHTAVVLPQDYDINSSAVPGIEHIISSTANADPVKVLIPGHIRATAGEVVFGRGSDADGRNLIDTIIQSLQSCPVYVRELVLSNIVVSGGTCMIPGFRARLLASLKEGLATAEHIGSATKAMQMAIRQPIGASSSMPLCYAWVGASAMPGDVISARGVDLPKYTAGDSDVYRPEALIG